LGRWYPDSISLDLEPMAGAILGNHYQRWRRSHTG
jgi:hypothetical protein